MKTKDLVKLPVVLSREEVRRILGQVRELRFAVPLRLIYLCGLRLLEPNRLGGGEIDREERAARRAMEPWGGD